MDLGHLAHLIRRADGVFYVLEHPAGDDVPEVIRAVHMEEAGEYGFAFAGEGIPPVDEEFYNDIRRFMDMDEREEDEDIGRPMDMDDQEDEDTDDSSVWTDGSDMESEDSGYDSMYEEDEEEDEEEEQGEDQDLGPRSPLVQQLPPDHFWQAWRQEYPPVPTGPPVPAHPPAGPPVPACPPVSAGPEESAPSTSGLGHSTKRIREESAAAQDSAKKMRRDHEDMDDEQPSTSGLSSSTFRRYFQAPLDDSDSD